MVRPIAPCGPWTKTYWIRRGDSLGNHLGEIVGIDRSVGALRAGLRRLGIEEDTLVWYCSDNGGLGIDPDSCGELRGNKGTIYEGGIRVPGIIEWPGHIAPTETDFPASTMDIMPTLVELLDLPEDAQLAVRDGESIGDLFKGRTPERIRPIPFYFHNTMALVEGAYKILGMDVRGNSKWSLYNLQRDPAETTDLAQEEPERFRAHESRGHSRGQFYERQRSRQGLPRRQIAAITTQQGVLVGAESLRTLF